ncbi:hypothetical protein MERGE_002330 [Pneumocystis wakefieldiae]|uniref:Rho-GAP domain-containing protein n=1 Tax=Pneumocystis wakefieldiae TaxID=38082 RepID=A0A899FX64_9ASCO|nr:hypothetical protein MERGE_002330 [Pneumocystis wakefieldiae]
MGFRAVCLGLTVFVLVQTLRYKEMLGYQSSFMQLYQRIKDRQMEKKFQAGMKYSEYGTKMENELTRTSKKAEPVSNIVVYRYGEKSHIQNDEKKETLLHEETSFPAEKMTEMHALSNNALTGLQLLETDQLSCGTFTLPEAKSTDPGSRFVSRAVSDDTKSFTHLSNKYVRDRCRISMDTNASIRALAPSRQSSYSSFSSAWTGSKLDLKVDDRDKMTFGFPCARKKESDLINDQELTALVGRLIFSAGIDDEGRPLVVINASNFPDSKVVDYDELLRRMLLVMDTFIDENDYSVILFAGGVRYRPRWNWLFQAYQSLGRKYRKYIKVLYIVHSTWWIRVMLDCMNHLVSPKFSQKMIYVSTLSELAKLVPFRQINVPPDVYAHNLKYESHVTLSEMSSESVSQMFGLSLSQLMGNEGENGLPKVVKDICAYIREEALMVEGLFRRSPSSILLKQVREAYDRGNPVTLSQYGPHLSAVLLKLYLRSLPEPLFTHNLYPLLRKISHQSSSKNILFIRNTLLPKLSTPSVILLANVCLLLHDVSLHSKENLMHPRNLSICISPTLVRHPTNPLLDVQLCNLEGGLGMMMVIAIESTYDIFDFVFPLNPKGLQSDMFQKTPETSCSEMMQKIPQTLSTEMAQKTSETPCSEMMQKIPQTLSTEMAQKTHKAPRSEMAQKTSETLRSGMVRKTPETLSNEMAQKTLEALRNKMVEKIHETLHTEIVQETHDAARSEMVQEAFESFIPSFVESAPASYLSQVFSSSPISCVSFLTSKQSGKSISLPESPLLNGVISSLKNEPINESSFLLTSKPNRSSNLTIRRQNLSPLCNISSTFRRSKTISVHDMFNSKLRSGIDISPNTKFSLIGSNPLKIKTGLVESLRNLYEEKSILKTPKDFDVSKLQGKRVII